MRAGAGSLAGDGSLVRDGSLARDGRGRDIGVEVQDCVGSRDVISIGARDMRPGTSPSSLSKFLGARRIILDLFPCEFPEDRDVLRIAMPGSAGI